MLLRLIALFALALPALGQGRASHCIALADGPARVLPASFGAPLAEDAVRINYVGHATFMLETPGGTTIATDFTGFVGPGILPDVVTMNRAHSSHWTPFPDPAIPHVLPGWGADGAPAAHALEVGELFVRNVPTDLRSGLGDRIPEANSIFVFETAGLCIAHLGHLHHEPSEAQYARLGRMDVVMAPVDGGFTIPQELMVQILQRMNASVVIPMHWFGRPNLERFVAAMAAAGFDVVRPEVNFLEVRLRDLPRPTVMVLEPQVLIAP